MNTSIGLTRSTRSPDEGRKWRKHCAQQAGLGIRHRSVRIDGLTFQAPGGEHACCLRRGASRVENETCPDVSENGMDRHSAVIRKQLDRIVEAAHRIFTDALEVEIAFDQVSERAGQLHRPPQLFGEGLETRGHVDRRPDDREVEPGARPILPYMTSPTWTPVP